MRNISFQSTVLATLFFLVVPAASAPQNGTRGTSVVPCDPIDKYTTSWFIGNVCKRPRAATCLFYTRGLSKTARIFSRSGGADMTTIWRTIVRTNPLRCIMQNPDLTRGYFASMSESMAIMCDVFVAVMDPNPASPRQDGIWGQVEFPTLTRNGKEGCVNAIASISPDGRHVVNIWTRPGLTCSCEMGNIGSVGEAKTVNDDSESYGIENDDVAAQFDLGGEFEVLWRDGDVAIRYYYTY